MGCPWKWKLESDGDPMDTPLRGRNLELWMKAPRTMNERTHWGRVPPGGFAPPEKSRPWDLIPSPCLGNLPLQGYPRIWKYRKIKFVMPVLGSGTISNGSGSKFRLKSSPKLFQISIMSLKSLKKNVDFVISLLAFTCFRAKMTVLRLC